MAGANGEISNIDIIGVEVDYNALGADDLAVADGGIAYYNADGDVIYCNIHHNGGSGVYYSDPQSSPKTGNFLYNLVNHNNQNEDGVGPGGLKVEGNSYYSISLNACNNVFAYNKMIDLDGPGNERAAIHFNCANGSRFKNNIVAFNTGNNYQVFVGTTNNSVMLDNNIYYGTGGYLTGGSTYFLFYKGSRYDLNHLIGTSTGYYSYDKSQDQNSMAEDPDLISESVLIPESNSPAHDAGANVGLIEDIAGTAVPQGNMPEIGAYELVE